MKSNLVTNLINGVYKKSARLFENPFKKVGFSWLKIRVLKNLPNYQLHTIDLLNKPFSFQSRDEFLHSLDEIFVTEIYKQQLRSDAYIIDCGANIGLSVIYLKQLFPASSIVAFEPDDVNFNLLTRNVQAFGLKDVELRKEAIWTENTQLRFVSEGSLMSRIGEKSEKGETIEVKACRLKDLLNKEIDFLKIDIEGAEYKVLKDIAENLSVVKNLFLEYHGTFDQNQELNEMLQIISNSGFKYYIKSAIDKHPTPFVRKQSPDYDIQLNIFGFRNS
jgi:FkbM family methyltransferase